jgi:DNA-directed RNA polymerase beta' subunit
VSNDGLAVLNLLKIQSVLIGNFEGQTFDGDEMNMHVPQSKQSSIEIENLASVPTQIITPAQNRPIISIVQDTLVGAYRFTKYDNYMTRSQVMNLLVWNNNFDGNLPEPDVKAGTPVDQLPPGFPLHKYNTSEDLWSGRTVISTVLPPINLVKKNDSYNDSDPLNYQNVVKIVQGKVVSGVFDKSVLGGKEQGIIHLIYNEYGPQRAKEFLDNITRIITNWILMSGFSVGVSDLVINDDAQDMIQKIISEKKITVSNIVQSIHDGTFKNDSGKSNSTEFEIQVNGALNKAIEDTGKVVAAHQLKTNRMVNMVESGSKGTKVNIAQVTACVGQQNVDGKRCPYGFSNRTLPHFSKYDDGPIARGFVENSFLGGLNPQEFFFHAMGGREGIIDTAIKTSESGYIQRKLVKAMEDVKVCEDGTVRDNKGSIVQFLYGEDGMNSEKIEKQKINSLSMNISELEKNYLISPSESWIKYLVPSLNMKYSQLSVQDRKEFYTKMERHYLQVLDDRRYMIEEVFKMTVSDEVYYPINLRRLIINAQNTFKTAETNYLSDLDPIYVLDQLDDLCVRLKIKDSNPANRVFNVLLRSTLSPKYLISQTRVNYEGFNYILDQIKFKHLEARAVPGMLVGAIAAQSIGEPCTQMSEVYGTKVLIYDGAKQMYYGSIGEFIDKLLVENRDKVVDLGGDSVVLDLSTPFSITGVSNEEKTSWREISQISRHPANGGLVKVTTRSGKTNTSTLSHSFLRRTQDSITSIKGSDLKLGDRIPVAKHINVVENALTEYGGFKLDRLFGWVCGIYLADGSISGTKVVITKIASIVETKLTQFVDQYGLILNTRFKVGEYGPSKDNIITSYDLKDLLQNSFSTGSYNKHLPGWVFASNLEFIQGLVGGYLDGDGNVNIEKQMIRVSSRSETLINDMCLLLAYSGIFASVLNEETVNQPNVLQYNLNIPKKYATIYRDQIGFSMEDKNSALEQIIRYNGRSNKHDSKEYIDKIPMCGELIADCGKMLGFKGHSRRFGRWTKKESIGRQTLEKYITEFEQEQSRQNMPGIDKKIDILKQAAYSDVVWDEIVKLEYLEDPQTYVYDFTVPGNDSFMVDTGILVHNTLNSVTHDTELLLKVNGEIEIVKIGEFTNKWIDMAEKTEDHPHDTKLAYINNAEEIYVPSCDKNGNTIWDRVEAVTRHPVVNKDGTSTILRVTTESGRMVEATKGKSFLTVDKNNNISHTNGDDLKVGEYVPVNNRALEMPSTKYLDLSKLLSKREYVFGSEIHKALDICQSYKDKGMKKAPWWKNHVDKDFVVPYKDSYGLIEASNGKPRKGSTFKQEFKRGVVYMKKQSFNSPEIPEQIELDFDFGYLIGAYLAEGCVTKTQISIANNETEYFAPINRLTSKWNITTKYYVHENKGQEGWTSSDLRLYSKLLTEIIEKLCGKLSHNKAMHNILFNSNKEFMRGVLSAYFGGDGCVHKDRTSITAQSVSKKLVDNLQAILCNWFGINAKIATLPMPTKNNRGTAIFHQPYDLRLNADSAIKFATEIPILLDYKQKRLDEIKTYNLIHNDIVPFYEDGTKQLYKRSEFVKHYPSIFTDVVFERIVNIEEIENPTEWMYDLSVQSTKNFNHMSGLALADTFHFAGISAKSAVTRGLPRLKEIISNSKNMKSPSITVHLDEEHQSDKEKAKQILNNIEITTIKNICLSSKIYYDPTNGDCLTQIEEDKDLLQIYNFFNELETSKERSPWILRLEFNKREMFDKDIRMLDIYHAIESKFSSDKNSVKDISYIYSDDNANKLIFRMEFQSSDTDDGSDSEDMILTIKNLEKTILNDIVIKGVKGITSVSMEKSDNYLFKVTENSDEYVKKPNWILYTEGSNLIDILSHPHVDATKTTSNNIYEIYEVLGIEAARNAILNEITELISADGTYVNYRHIALLADTMTNKGSIMSIDRHGINKSNRGPLPKCSFEETTDMLAKAAIFGELDKMDGVSSNIMFGQEVPCGTGMVEVLFDEEKFIKNLVTINETDDDVHEELDEKRQLIDLYCSESNFEFNTSI